MWVKYINFTCYLRLLMLEDVCRGFRPTGFYKNLGLSCCKLWVWLRITQFSHIWCSFVCNYYVNLTQLCVICARCLLFRHVQPLDNFYIAYMVHISRQGCVIDAQITTELHINGSIITHSSQQRHRFCGYSYFFRFNEISPQCFSLFPHIFT